MDPITLGLLGSGAISAIGGVIGNVSSAKMQNEASAANSAANNAFQERMSNTAHQREVADLRAAGLNPILSATGGGSSTPSGSVAPVVGPDIAGPLSNLSSSAVQALRTSGEMKQIASGIEKTNAETVKTGAETQLTLDNLKNNSSTRELQALNSQLMRLNLKKYPLDVKNLMEQTRQLTIGNDESAAKNLAKGRPDSFSGKAFRGLENAVDAVSPFK